MSTLRYNHNVPFNCIGVYTSISKNTPKTNVSYNAGDTVEAANGYKYTLTCDRGTWLTYGGLDHNSNQIWYRKFTPFYSPSYMLTSGVFEGKYLNDDRNEFPESWFYDADRYGSLREYKPDAGVNYFTVKSRMTSKQWRDRDLKHFPRLLKNNPDPKGWFQWYCRYYLGRRIPSIDRIQINRWLRIRSLAHSVKQYGRGNIDWMQWQRQRLLQWSYKCDN
jgi:hypothetical protein